MPNQRIRRTGEYVMLKKSTLLAALLTLSSLAFTQQRSLQEAAKDAPDTTTCSFTYSSGSGTNQTTYCLSVNGNIVQFSRPSSVEYIKQGMVVEGYGICDVTASHAYFDHFGWSLAVGNFNGDSLDDLAIGVPDEDIGSVAGAGAVNVRAPRSF
jgi:hypothetical protein